jgi:hypothetical protein
MFIGAGTYLQFAILNGTPVRAHSRVLGHLVVASFVAKVQVDG